MFIINSSRTGHVGLNNDIKEEATIRKHFRNKHGRMKASGEKINKMKAVGPTKRYHCSELRQNVYNKDEKPTEILHKQVRRIHGFVQETGP